MSTKSISLFSLLAFIAVTCACYGDQTVPPDKVKVSISVVPPDKWTEKSLAAMFIVTNISKNPVQCDLSIYKDGGIVRIWRSSHPLTEDEMTSLTAIISRRYVPIEIAPGESYTKEFNLLEVAAESARDILAIIPKVVNGSEELRFTSVFSVSSQLSNRVVGKIEVHTGKVIIEKTD